MISLTGGKSSRLQMTGDNDGNYNWRWKHTLAEGFFLCDLELLPKNTNSGTRRRIEIFQKSKMIRIENPKLLAWFQTPHTVSRPSRPDFQPRKTNSGSRRPIEIFKKRKMIRIEFPKVLAWFQTPQTVSRLSRPNFQPRKDPNSSGWNPSCFLCGHTSNAARGKPSCFMCG